MTVSYTHLVGVTRTGYTFASWNTEANGSGTSYQAGNNLTVTADVTLYAQLSLIHIYGHSNETAGDNSEEGGDDVKSSCPLCSGLHTLSLIHI